ncbi:MAG: ornithine cyclodeaminase family protein [Candidatus Dormibacteria bacterium]
MNEVLVVDGPTVHRLLPMAECIEVMADTLASLARGEGALPLRQVMPVTGSDGLVALMPGQTGGASPVLGLKVVSVFPGNTSRALDTHQGAVVLIDPETGAVSALVEGAAVTAIRTAAVSAVATRLLSAPDAGVLAILGAGVQARTHLEAMACIRPICSVRVWNRTSERARAFAREEAERYEFEVEVKESAAEALAGAGIVVTATHSRAPVLRREWLAPGAHVNSVGARPPDGRELDTATVAGARLYVDRRESALSEGGDIRGPIAEGAIGAGHMVGELGELVAGMVPGRESWDGLTVFKSFGLAVEDLAAAELVVRRARLAGLGTTARL